MSMNKAQKAAIHYVETMICPPSQCELCVGEEDEQFYKFYFINTITDKTWTVKIAKNALSLTVEMS